MKYLSKEQYAYKLNVNPDLFDSKIEISKYEAWFNIKNKNKNEKKKTKRAILWETLL